MAIKERLLQLIDEKFIQRVYCCAVPISTYESQLNDIIEAINIRNSRLDKFHNLNSLNITLKDIYELDVNDIADSIFENNF